MPPTEGPWARPVFSVAGAVSTWRDVAVFAVHDGRWARLETEIAEGVACIRHGLTVESADVTAAANDFRYRRRLISAEETEAWLAARRLDVGQWMDHIRRSVLRVVHEPALATLLGARPAAPEEIESRLWATGVCNGMLAAAADDLATVAAVADRVGVRADRDDVLDLLREQITTGSALEDVVGQRQLDWLRVGVDEAWFDSEGAAREARLSLLDGLDIDEVCALAGARRDRRSAHLEELDPTMRRLLASAGEGELLGPVPSDGGYSVIRVESKVVPTLADPTIRGRAEAALLARAARREVEERVQWHERV